MPYSIRRRQQTRATYLYWLGRRGAGILRNSANRYRTARMNYVQKGLVLERMGYRLRGGRVVRARR